MEGSLANWDVFHADRSSSAPRVLEHRDPASRSAVSFAMTIWSPGGYDCCLVACSGRNAERKSAPASALPAKKVPASPPLPQPASRVEPAPPSDFRGAILMISELTSPTSSGHLYARLRSTGRTDVTFPIINDQPVAPASTNQVPKEYEPDPPEDGSGPRKSKKTMKISTKRTLKLKRTMSPPREGSRFLTTKARSRCRLRGWTQMRTP